MSNQVNHVSEIFIVRHGHSIRNDVKYKGRYLATEKDQQIVEMYPDYLVPLTEKGVQQAREIGKRLKDIAPFDFYYDSGYVRSKETMNLILTEINDTDKSKRRSHLDLREREPGYTFDMTADEVVKNFPWLAKYEEKTGKFYQTPPGGESIAHVCSRVHMFLNSLRRARSGKRVLIVTHGRVMQCFRYWLEKIQADEVARLFEKGDIENCQVLQYSWNEEEHSYSFIHWPTE